MKKLKNQKQILSALFIVFCIIFSATFLYIGSKIIPHAITYSASTEKNSITVSENTPVFVDECSYESIYGITDEGPFNISADGENIYVFSGNSRLYRIKATLSQFPQGDRYAIASGINVKDKSMLYEIVEYMES